MARAGSQLANPLLHAIAAAVSIVWGCCASACATENAECRAADGDWLAAAIALGPHDDLDRPTLHHRYRQLLDHLHRSADVIEPPLDRARAIHCRLHAELFRTYDASAYDLGRQLADGTYNCATATLVFLSAAEHGGLDAWAGQWVGHVAPVVAADGQSWVIEIATPTWTCWRLEQPGTVSRAERAAPVRRVGPHELAAALWFNRGVATADRQQFAASVAAYTQALRLDAECRPAAANRLATLNNWAVALVRGGHEQAALDVLGRGLALSADYGPLLRNRAYLRSRGEPASAGSGGGREPTGTTATAGAAGANAESFDEPRFVNY